MRSLSTRSLMTLNKNDNKDWRKKYNLHIKKIEQIQNHHKSNTKKLKEQQTKVAQALQRSKEISKKFKTQQQLTRRINQDRKMIETLIDIHQRPRIKSQISKMKLRLQTMPSRSISRERCYQQQKIQVENKRLALSLLQSATGIKKYKKKIRGQINQYIKMRNNLHKIKPIQQPIQQNVRSNRIDKINRLEMLIRQKEELIELSKSKTESDLPYLSKQLTSKTETL